MECKSCRKPSKIPIHYAPFPPRLITGTIHSNDLNLGSLRARMREVLFQYVEITILMCLEESSIELIEQKMHLHKKLNKLYEKIEFILRFTNDHKDEENFCEVAFANRLNLERESQQMAAINLVFQNLYFRTLKMEDNDECKIAMKNVLVDLEGRIKQKLASTDLLLRKPFAKQRTVPNTVHFATFANVVEFSEESVDLYDYATKYHDGQRC